MSADRPEPVSAEEIDRLVQGGHRDPHSILGAHPHAGRVTIRTLQPDADGVTLVAGPTRIPLGHQRAGVWAGVWPYPEIPDYRLDVTGNGTTSRVDDPYRFAPSIGELDQHLIGEGRHEQLWEVLGAHVRTYESLVAPVVGTSFAVWAPNAQGVRVVGDFNDWDGTGHAMRSVGSTGVWELFVPEVGDGTKYKFHILGADGVWRMKIDPLAFATEVPPATASVVFTPRHRWNDAAWLERRRRTDWVAAPMSIYELHLGSWRQGRSYRQLAEELVDYVQRMGFTHVEFLPVAEHPFEGSWGYQISAFYAPTARFGSPDDFRHLVDRLHQAGIGVIVDWVPANFPRDEWALGRFDGTPLYEHPDPRRGEHPDWGTYVFDFGRHEVRNFLVANARFWCEEFHIDGLRVDAVASMLYLDYSRSEGQWVPNRYGGHENLEAISFLQETNAVVHDKVPQVLTIAEESTAWPGVTSSTSLGGLGFDFKWNMGWMHDTLGYLSRPPIYRQYHHQEMTFSMVYAHSENYVLPLSHDEVVHGKGSLLGKMPGDRWQQLANLRALLAYMWAHPGKQLLFMGAELAEEREWSESRSLDWELLDAGEHRGVWQLVRDLNRLYGQLTALHTQDTSPSGFAWIDADDASGNVFSFLRLAADGSTLVCLANFAGVPHEGYRVGLPSEGTWREVLNTDTEAYGGSGVGNLGQVEAVARPSHGQPASATLRLPPLGVLWLVPGVAANKPGRSDRPPRSAAEPAG